MNPLLLLVVLLSSAGQILVKLGADKTLPPSAVDPAGSAAGLTLFRRALNPYLLAGMACVVLVPLLYTRALAGMPLSRAYGATGLTYPLVILASAVVLKERVGRRQVAGGLLILAGFLLWSGGR